MMNFVHDVMVAFFSADGWLTESIDDATLVTTVEGKHGLWQCIAGAMEEEQIFTFYSIAPLQAPPAKYPFVTELVTRLNDGIAIGNFEFDYQDGTISFKTSIAFDDLPSRVANPVAVGAALLKPLVHVNVSMMDRFLPAIVVVVNGDTLPAEAIAVVEQW